MGHDDHDHAHDHHHHGDHTHPHSHAPGHSHGHDHARGDAEPHVHTIDFAHLTPKRPAEDVLRERTFGPPRKMIDIGEGVSLAVIDEGPRGAGSPPILFLHGFPTSASLFRGSISRLSDRARCIAPDLLGFGESEGPADIPVGLDAHADMVARLLDKLDIAEATVVGHDWGGSVAQVLVERHPERIARLVLCDCPCFGFVPPRRLRAIAAMARFSPLFDLLIDSGALGAFARSPLGMREGAFTKTALTADAIDHYLAPLFRDAVPAYRAARERFRRATIAFYAPATLALLEKCADALRRFERPTLIVWGCEDPYLSVSWAKRLKDAIPGCKRLELLPFCGHWVPEERPQELADLIAAHVGVSAEIAGF